MNSVSAIWFQFVLCATLIGVAGYQLSRYGDAIAQRTGMSGSWVVNLVFLVVIDSIFRKEPIWSRAGHSHVLAAMYLLNTYVLYLHGE